MSRQFWQSTFWRKSSAVCRSSIPFQLKIACQNININIYINIIMEPIYPSCNSLSISVCYLKNPTTYLIHSTPEPILAITFSQDTMRLSLRKVAPWSPTKPDWLLSLDTAWFVGILKMLYEIIPTFTWIVCHPSKRQLITAHLDHRFFAETKPIWQSGFSS